MRGRDDDRPRRRRDVKLDDRTVSRLHARIDDRPRRADDRRRGFALRGDGLGPAPVRAAPAHRRAGDPAGQRHPAGGERAWRRARSRRRPGRRRDRHGSVPRRPNATIVVPVNATALGLRAPAPRRATARCARGCGPGGRSSSSRATPRRSATSCATCAAARFCAWMTRGRRAARAARRPAHRRRAARPRPRRCSGRPAPGRLARLIAGLRGARDARRRRPDAGGEARARAAGARVQAAREDIRLDPRLLRDAPTGTGGGSTSRRSP